MRLFTFVLFYMVFSSVISSRVLQPSLLSSATSPAVQRVTELPMEEKVRIMTKVKASTDGINLALNAASSNDLTKVLKGIGDAVAVLPGAWGYAGMAFSIGASLAALLGGGDKEDPVVIAITGLQKNFDHEMHSIETSLNTMQDKVNVILTGIDQVLQDISDIPAKVVADMKLTDVTTMKDKFVTVQRAAIQYANGNLTRTQMISKCDDFHIASLVSELETLLQDEKHLFTAKFGTQDQANGRVQLQLLLFYISIIPIISNCNALKYTIESIEADGMKSDEIIKLVQSRATWYLQPADQTIYVRERFSPFASIVDTNGMGDTKQEWRLSFSFLAYSFMPPHGQCFEVVKDGGGGGTLLMRRSIELMAAVPNKSIFCLKIVATDDASNRIIYAERSNAERTVSLMQPEVNDNFDPLNVRGWTLNTTAMYAGKVDHWIRLPMLTLLSNFIIIQGQNEKQSLEDVTNQCRENGEGFDRDGDGHSKEYQDAPWTIFCVQYAKKSIRDVDTTTSTFLSDVTWNEMDAKDAWTASCPDNSYTRDKNHLTIPSKIRKKWFGLGVQTIKAYAVCLRWIPMTIMDAPNHFVKRVWLDDSKPMADKPQKDQNEGDQAMQLPQTH